MRGNNRCMYATMDCTESNYIHSTISLEINFRRNIHDEVDLKVTQYIVQHFLKLHCALKSLKEKNKMLNTERFDSL